MAGRSAYDCRSAADVSATLVAPTRTFAGSTLALLIPSGRPAEACVTTHRIFGATAKRYLGVAVAGAICIGAVSSCGSEDKSAGKKANNGLSVSSLTVGFFRNPNPERVAQDKGWFADEMGVPVKFKEFTTGADMITGLSSNAIQLACGAGSPPVATAAAQGIPVEIFWVLENAAEALAVKRSKNINSLGDLVGKKTGMIVGSTMYFAFSVALEKNGIDSKKVEVVDGAQPDLAAAFIRGDLDAFYATEPFLSQALKADGRVLLTSNEVAQKYGYSTFDGCLTLKPWRDKHADVLKKWVAVENRAVAYYRSNPDDSYKSIAKLLGISASEAEKQSKLYTFPDAKQQLTARWLGTSATREEAGVAKAMATTVELLKGLGKVSQVSQDFKPASVADPAFVEAEAKH